MKYLSLILILLFTLLNSIPVSVYGAGSSDGVVTELTKEEEKKYLEYFREHLEGDGSMANGRFSIYSLNRLNPVTNTWEKLRIENIFDLLSPEAMNDFLIMFDKNFKILTETPVLYVNSQHPEWAPMSTHDIAINRLRFIGKYWFDSKHSLKRPQYLDLIYRYIKNEAPASVPHFFTKEGAELFSEALVKPQWQIRGKLAEDFILRFPVGTKVLQETYLMYGSVLLNNFYLLGRGELFMHYHFVVKQFRLGTNVNPPYFYIRRLRNQQVWIDTDAFSYQNAGYFGFNKQHVFPLDVAMEYSKWQQRVQNNPELKTKLKAIKKSADCSLAMHTPEQIQELSKQKHDKYFDDE